MSAIKEKIIKLLALSASPNEKEAQEALLKARCEDIWAREQGRRSATDLREMCNAFGWGFCDGLEDAFRQQEKEHQEWGLVLAVPQAVKDIVSQMGNSPTQTVGWPARDELAKVTHTIPLLSLDKTKQVCQRH